MPSVVYINISSPMFVPSMKIYKLKLLYICKEKADFQKLFLYFTDTYLLFSKQAMYIFKISSYNRLFVKIGYDMFRLKNGGKHQNFVPYSENKNPN